MSQLYAGTTRGNFGAGHIFAYDGGTWTDLTTGSVAGLDTCFSLALFNGTLYALVEDTDIGTTIWSFDGGTWTKQIPTGIPLSAPVDYGPGTTPGSLIVWQGQLWAFLGAARGFRTTVAVLVLNSSGDWEFVADNFPWYAQGVLDLSEQDGTLALAATTRGGQDEIVFGAWSVDAWGTFDGTTLTYRDMMPASSCVWAVIEDPDGYLHSTNEYGWTYVSTDARTWTTAHVSPYNTPRFTPHINEDVSGRVNNPVTFLPVKSIWTLFKYEGQLYAGTCIDSSLDSHCDIRKWLGNTWIDPTFSNEVVSHDVFHVTNTGFISSAVQDSTCYIGSGQPWYYARTPAESKVFQFDGSSITELTNNSPTLNSQVQFDAGVQCLLIGGPGNGWSLGKLRFG